MRRWMVLTVAALALAGCGRPSPAERPLIPGQVAPGHLRAAIGPRTGTDDGHRAEVERIVRDRMQRAGLTGGRVWTSRSTVLVDVPAESGKEGGALFQAGRFEARPVLDDVETSCVEGTCTSSARTGPAVFDGTAIATVAPAGPREITMTLTAAGRRTWVAWTARHPGKKLAFTVDGRTLNAPETRPGTSVLLRAASPAAATALLIHLEQGSYPPGWELQEVQWASRIHR